MQPSGLRHDKASWHPHQVLSSPESLGLCVSHITPTMIKFYIHVCRAWVNQLFLLNTVLCDYSSPPSQNGRHLQTIYQLEFH